MTNEATYIVDIPVLLMVERAATRRRVKEHLTKAAFNVLPFANKNTAYDFAKLSDDGCVIVTDVGGLSARHGAVMLNRHEQPTGIDLPVILLSTRKERDRLDDEVRQRADYCLVNSDSEQNLGSIVHAASAEHTRMINLRNEARRRKSAIGIRSIGRGSVRRSPGVMATAKRSTRKRSPS